MGVHVRCVAVHVRCVGVHVRCGGGGAQLPS